VLGSGQSSPCRSVNQQRIHQHRGIHDNHQRSERGWRRASRIVVRSIAAEGKALSSSACHFAQHLEGAKVLSGTPARLANRSIRSATSSGTWRMYADVKGTCHADSCILAASSLVPGFGLRQSLNAGRANWNPTPWSPHSLVELST
jgi:hypothetical protein